MASSGGAVGGNKLAQEIHEEFLVCKVNVHLSFYSYLSVMDNFTDNFTKTKKKVQCFSKLTSLFSS